MIKGLAGLTAAALAAAFVAGPATAKAMKPKMVMVYQAEKCHMYFSPTEAKHDHYVCAVSGGKMHMMMVTPAFAAKVLPKTTKTNGTM